MKDEDEDDNIKSTLRKLEHELYGTNFEDQNIMTDTELIINCLSGLLSKIKEFENHKHRII